MSTIIADSLRVTERDLIIPMSQLGHRVIKEFRNTYTGGEWNPAATYSWVPGMFVDYSPADIFSRIRVSCHIPYASRNAAHAISHWIFYANNVELGRHSISGNHIEDNSVYVWDFSSWGTIIGRIGYQMRSYVNDNNETRVYTTRYWDGTGSQQNCFGQLIVEEYLPGA
jgi:hypothetical protein